MGLLADPHAAMIRKAPQFGYVWCMILSKTIRVLFDPFHKDHWDDIIGYATLAQRLVEKGDTNDVSSH